MNNFKVEQSGFYRTRDGRCAEVIIFLLTIDRKWAAVGYLIDSHKNFPIYTWRLDGHVFDDYDTDLDLVEYLGKERPKEKKVVRMAPVLFCNCVRNRYFITDELYPSIDDAKKFSECDEDIFVRWLIDTHAVEVEVEG